MKISIREAFKEIASEKYNKKNIAIFLGLILLAGICSIFMQNKSNLLVSGLSILAYLFIIILSCGIFIKTVKNNYENKEEFLPNAFENISDTLLLGLKNMAGGFLFGFGIGIIMGIIAFIFNKLPLINVILIPAFAVIISLLTIALYILFIITPKFTSWFKIKEAYKLLNENIKAILLYIWKAFILFLICLAITIVIALIFIVFYTIFGTITGSTPEQARIAGSICGSILSTFTFGTMALFVTSLLAQLIKNIYKTSEEN